MNAKKCDRCMSYYDNNTVHTYKNHGGHLHGMLFETTEGFRVWKHDLCDRCIDELKLFLSGRKLAEVKLEKPTEETTNENL